MIASNGTMLLPAGSNLKKESLTMSHTTILTRAEIESMGPPLPEELADTGISEQFLCDLTLKHVAMLPEPTTQAVSERINLPRTLAEDLLQQLYREKLIEVKKQSAIGSTPLRDVGPRLGPSDASVVDFRLRWAGAGIVARLHAHDEVAVDPVQHGRPRCSARAFHDLVLPDSLLQTLGCVINSRRSCS